MTGLANTQCFNCKRVIARSLEKPNRRITDAQGKDTKCPWCKQHMAPRQSMRNKRENKK